MCIPGEDVYSIVIHPADRECMHILTGNGDVPHGKGGCASSGMGMCLTGNAHSLYRVNMPHRECT